MRKFIILMLLITSPVSATIYKWTDSNGNVHFGDKPAEEASATELNIKVNNKTGVTHSSGNKKEREYLLKKIEENKQADAKRKSKKIAENKKRRKKCDAYKRRYQNLIQSNRSYTMSPDGERTYKSEAERETRKKKLNKSIAKYCR